MQDLKNLWTGMGIDVNEELTEPHLMLYNCSRCTLLFFDPCLAGGNKFYSALGNFDWYYLHPGKTEYDYVQKYVKENSAILDVGAGRGVLFTKIEKKVDYQGLELSTKAVELAQNSNINVIQEDLIVHAERNQSKYDIVCLFQVLEHLTELDDFINSVFLTLKPGGLFVIAVPNNTGFVSYTPNYTFNLPPHHSILWTESSLRYLASKYKFEVVEVHKELLQEVHKDYAYQSFIASHLKSILLLPNALLDKSRSHNLISRIVRKVYTNPRIQKILLPTLMKRQKYGQSILITLKKPTQ